MKTLASILIFMFALTAASAQGNHVFGGAELVNYAVMDISAVRGIAFSTERSSQPGYYSAIDTANFTGCTDAANIDGYIKKYGNKAFIFPVGSGNDIRTLEISAPALSTDTYATAWIPGDPGNDLDHTAPNAGRHSTLAMRAPLGLVSNVGQWDWQVGDAANLGAGTTGTGVGLTITVSIPDMTDFARQQQLRLAGWNGSQWIDLSGRPTATGTVENSTLTGTMVAGITAIAIASVSKVRPFHIDDNNASAMNCFAQLKWTTHNENDIERFVIEKGFDNLHFSAVNTIKANGTGVVNNYSVAIPHNYGTAYFRIRAEHSDGSFDYTDAIAVKSDCGVTEYMLLYPNPTTAYDDLHVSFETTYIGKGVLVIYNSVGQKMKEQSLNITSGSNNVKTDVRRFAAGIYFLSILKADGKIIGTSQQFIKQ